MKTELINLIDHPAELEKLYRNNKTEFIKAFEAVYPEIHEHVAAQVWNQRLHYKQEEIGWGSKKEGVFIVLSIFLAGLLAKLPLLLSLNEEQFYTRNIPFLVFPFLSAYYAWKQKQQLKMLFFPATIVIIAALFINLLPNTPKSDSILLACIHLPFLLWTVSGFSFMGGRLGDANKRIGFLRYNGDFVVMCALMVLAGIIFSGITNGLFSIIKIDITKVYSNYILPWALTGIPIMASLLVHNNPQLVSKISPVIARIFTPIVLVTLFIFLASIIYTGNYPNDDRNFLLIFNVMLIAVMALILFSVSEVTKTSKIKTNLLILLGLSFLAIVVNLIALSAIVIRLQEFGITPNRIAILGANLLILINLALVAFQLFNTVRTDNTLKKVEKSITQLLPYYSIWTALVSFVFPLLFHFK